MSLIINVARNDFYSSVSSLQSVTSKRGTIAILSNILIETGVDCITLTATDLEIGLKTTVKAEIIAEGSITLPSRKLFEIIRETAEEHLRLEVLDNNWTKISTTSGSYKLAGTDSEEFPSFPEYDQTNLATIACDILRENIEKTVFSVAQEGENQFTLTGGLVEKESRAEKNFLRFVSSDGHRLSLMEREVDTDLGNLKMEKTILIPRKGIMEIKKQCEQNEFIELGFDNKQAVLRTAKTITIIRLMNGDFPDYRNIIKSISRENCIEIDRQAFISAMRRINLFTEDLFNSVQFHFTKDKLTLTSQNMDIGSAKEELLINYDGEELNLGFNGKYFVEALQVMTSEKIKAYINTAKSPCLVEGEDDRGFMSVIMPMKI